MRTEKVLILLLLVCLLLSACAGPAASAPSGASRNPLQSVAQMSLHIAVAPDEDENYKIDELVINDRIRLEQSFEVWGSQPEERCFLDLGPLLAEKLFSWEDLRSFRCRVQKTTRTEDTWEELPLFGRLCRRAGSL